MQKNRPATPQRHTSLSKDPASLGGDPSALADPKERSPSFIVGIGASAGGLDSLEKFFRHMTDRSGLAFVVIQHLSPDYKS